nr:MAG TPA: hypothetical protein [Caudoviricetes sp.]
MFTKYSIMLQSYPVVRGLHLESCNHTLYSLLFLT